MLLTRRLVVCDVGATWHEIIADDTVEALVEFARRQQITQIVLGSSQRGRWQEVRGGGSIVKRVTRRATGAEVDVHIIARRHEAADANSDEGLITGRGGGAPQTHMGRWRRLQYRCLPSRTTAFRRVAELDLPEHVRPRMVSISASLKQIPTAA